MLNRFFNKPAKTVDNSELFESVCTLIRNLIDDDKVKLTKETRLEDLGFDSIKYIHLLLSLEDIVNLELEKIVEEVDTTQILTVGDIVELVGKIKK